MTLTLEFLASPRAFLEAASELLGARPVASTIVSTVAERMVREEGTDVPHGNGPEDWWVVVRQRGQIVGAAMRTAPFAPYPPYLLDMPAEAAVQFARTLHERGERVDAVNGALPAARICAEELARLTGRRVEVVEHLRLFELGELRAPANPVAGHLRAATADDVALALAWYTAFGADAAAQAGHTQPHSMVHDDEDSMLRRIEAGRVHLWCLPDGTPVHVTGDNPPSFGVARVGPVYTPRERRGRGYASAAVHEVSRMIRESGARACLFTDQANPTSNALYQRLGYEFVEDHVTQVLV